MKKIGRDINLTTDDIQYIKKLIQKNPSISFHLPEFRRYFTSKRLNKVSKNVEVWNGDTDQGVAPGTVKHNMTELTTRGLASVQRTTRLLGPLSSLSPIYEKAGKLKVLTIGPRTEMEIFHLIAIGFSPENIYGLDLISYSDYITAADMHKMPYKDGVFDVVISSWTIGYSSNPQLVIDEMCRVTKKNGLLAVGYTHDHNIETYVDDNKEPNHIKGCSFKTGMELMSYFKQYKTKIHYLQEPDDASADKMMLILRVFGRK
tara:strand:+ start:5900 stop:6679 length:780 start_codon:yes stop_codon:yes gene_type:complete